MLIAWEPCRILTWLGIDINFLSGTLKITKSRTDSILNTIFLRKIFVSTRTLAKLAGQLISTKYLIGDIVQLKTRFLYKSIEQSSSWNKTFNIGNYNDTVDETLFWKFDLVKYNNKVINCYNIPLFHVHSDGSNTVNCLRLRRKEKEKYLLQKAWFCQSFLNKFWFALFLS